MKSFIIILLLKQFHQNPEKINRKLSNWCHGKLQERISFKALAEGFRHEQVNPAYGSQTCPSCDFVDQKNRSMDKFKCLFCGHEGLSDQVAAQNYARRFGDQEIGLYMPKGQVKTILQSRFHRRLEAEQSATVPGRTRDTVADIYPQLSVRNTKEAGRGNSLYRAVNPRVKQNKHV